MKRSLLAVGLSACVTQFSFAGELTYTPVNPAFGGNPLNSSYLLGVANAINDHSAPASDYYSGTSALESLTASLEARLMSQLLSDVGNGNTGQLVTEDYVLNIVDEDGSLLVQITDKTTGESSTIQVSGLIPDL
ncbi:MAG: curli assembly protein CsgF [Vibrio sp.]